jgi:thioredoxin-like negative regulator of GroEL
MFEKVSNEVSDWEFETIDIDQNPDAAQEYVIRGIPTTAFLIDGKVVGKVSGVLQPAQLKERLVEYSTPAK